MTSNVSRASSGLQSVRDEVLRGHCACGALSYTISLAQIEQDLTLSAFCHCSRCQRINGAPFVWSTHWLYSAVSWSPPSHGPPPGAPGSNDSHGLGQAFSPAISTFETMKGRKWKLRCSTCGSPLGSWNAAKQKYVRIALPHCDDYLLTARLPYRWTIWPSTLARRPAQAGGPDDVLADGPIDASTAALHAIRPTHHQFYGLWRSVVMRDGLPKWTGYKDESQRVTDEGD